MNWRLIITGILGGALFCPLTAVAIDTHQPLTSEQMEELLPGNTIKGEYRYLCERTRTFNFREIHYRDGTTSYIEGHIRAIGRWYTLGQQKICYKYPDNPEMLTSCFWVYENAASKSKCYYGFGIDGMTLESDSKLYV